MSFLNQFFSTSTGKRFIGVGIVTVDIINHVDHYPAEDEALRAVKHRKARGGNVSNTLCVLSGVLGEKCSLVSTIAPGADANFVLHDLHANNVETNYCRMCPNYSMPTSYITLNEANGSRTIVHYRDLPELSAADFINHVNLDDCDWVHFEGRNVEQVTLMMRHINEYNEINFSKRKSITISLEVERAKLVNFEPLLIYADVVFFSKEFAQSRDCSSALELLELFRLKSEKKSILICAWGENGATALDTNDQSYHSSAFSPPKVVDTLGAGDTFIAGTLHALRAGKSLEKAIRFGCRLGGVKCGVEGFHIENFDMNMDL